MDRQAFWKNWTIARNGVAFNIEFFANSFEHAERTLRACGEYMPAYPASLDAYVKPAKGGGYVAGFIAPIQIAESLRPYIAG